MYYGKEFCGHAQIDEALGSTCYFARPFASWEGGSNENFNGLLLGISEYRDQLIRYRDQLFRYRDHAFRDRDRLVL